MKPPVTQLVAITCADDSVAVMAFVIVEFNKDDSARWIREASDENIQFEVDRNALSFDSEKLPVKGWVRVDRIPTDRYFRNAWVHDGESFSVDMPKAREIHRNNLRELRAPLLADLDVEYMKALEAGDAKSAADVAAQKQALRDATTDAAIDAAITPEELKAVIPDALKG